MQAANRMRLLAIVALSVCMVAAGCGTSSPTKKEVKGVPVSGKLQQNGKVIKLKKEEVVALSFVQSETSKEDQVSAQAEYNPDDGTFVVKGPTGQGLPPGKYKISLASDFTDGSGGESRFGDEFDAQEGVLIAEVGSEEGQFF